MNDTTMYENLNSFTINPMDQMYLPPFYPMHWHEHIELLAIPIDASSTATIRVNQRDYCLHPGDWLVIWSGELHEIKENIGKELIGLQIPIIQIQSQPDLMSYSRFYRHVHYLAFQEHEQVSEQMHWQLNQMFALRDEKKEFYRLEMMICFYELFMDLCRFLGNTFSVDTKEQESINKNQPILRDACSYIIEHCDESLSLSMMANRYGFSTYYFSRIFKQYTGYGFVDYVTIQRINYARQLLADASQSVTEISYQIGFRSISSFNRAFRKLTGCSPREYRNYHWKKQPTSTMEAAAPKKVASSAPARV